MALFLPSLLLLVVEALVVETVGPTVEDIDSVSEINNKTSYATSNR